MTAMTLAVWSSAITGVLMCAACVTDLRSRRIPNQLTFSAILIGLVSHLAMQGWGGLMYSVSGALLAPSILCLLHGGKGPAAGDLKLAAALGANLGPPLGTFAILLSAIAGGILAAVWLLVLQVRIRAAQSSLSAEALARAVSDDAGGTRIEDTLIPYGVALSVGTLTTLFIYWATGGRPWFM